MKINKLFGRPINEWAMNLNYEEHLALFNYMIDKLKELNINYEIEKRKFDENYVYIRVDCDDEMMGILRNLYLDYEYWDEDYDERKVKEERLAEIDQMINDLLNEKVKILKSLD